MIQHLLKTLVTHLQNSLPEVKQIQLGPLATPPTEPLPIIILYPAKFEFSQTPKDSPRISHPPQTFQLLREFQQEWLMDIYDTDRAALEKWASLTMGLILIDSDEIIEVCNNSANDYVTDSKKLVTTHRIEHIQLIEGRPIVSESLFQWQLKFNVSGHIKLSKQTTDVGIIQQILSPSKTDSKEPIDIEVFQN
jgi:hypothetical protein